MLKSLTISKNDVALLRRDPVPFILLVVMPLIVMAFLKPAFAPVLQLLGHPGATGAEQVVPGVSVMFAYFVVGFAGAWFFREHIWGTWDRVRASELSNTQILAGKLLPALGLVGAQQAILFLLGFLVFDLHRGGSLAALVIIDVAFCVFIVAFTFFVIAICHSLQQVNAVAGLGTIVLGAIGGAITPLAAMPEWAKTLAPFTPTYWAMRGFNSVLLDGDGLSAVVGPVAVLLAMAAVLTVIAAVRFSVDDQKTGTL